MIEGESRPLAWQDALTVLPISGHYQQSTRTGTRYSRDHRKTPQLDIQFEPALMDIELGRWSGQSLTNSQKMTLNGKLLCAIHSWARRS